MNFNGFISWLDFAMGAVSESDGDPAVAVAKKTKTAGESQWFYRRPEWGQEKKQR